MYRFLIVSVLASVLAASSVRGVEEGSLHDAAAYLAAGEGDRAAAELMAYGRREPAAPLANQALDCVLLLYKKEIKPDALANYVDALALLADGYASTADVVFREMAANRALPWAIRGRATLLAADLDSRGDRVALLERAWRECDDETARLLGVALADAYYKEGRAKEAREVRDDFEKRFPGDEGLKYFEYLYEEAER
jgi:hypothetical protein